MSSQKVWSTFEAKKKDGTVLKLKIQDTPQDRMDDVVEIFMTYFCGEEAMHKAVGITKDAESVVKYKEMVAESFSNPTLSIVICCADEDQVKDIMGVSIMVNTDSADDSAGEMDEKLEKNGTPLLKKLNCVYKECAESFEPMKEYGLKKFYEDRGLCVVPDYRGLGIAQQFFNVRRMICKAHGIPMTGALMTAYGTQKAAIRDGWKTVKEISYDYLEEKHGVTFVDVPPTMKYMIPDDQLHNNNNNTKQALKNPTGCLPTLNGY